MEGVYLGKHEDEHLVGINGWGGMMQWGFKEGWIMPMAEAERRRFPVVPPYVGEEISLREKRLLAEHMGETIAVGVKPVVLEATHGTTKQ